MILIDIILAIALFSLAVKLIKPVGFGLLVATAFPVYWAKNLMNPEKRNESITVLKAILSPVIILLAIIAAPFINAYRYRAKYPLLSAILFTLAFIFGSLLLLVA